jgi:NAD-dependent deacetylase
MGDDYFQASKVISGCELLLVAGSSLQVYPVASLPDYAKRLVIINLQDTPYDHQAEIVLHEKTGKVFEDIMAALEKK